MQFDVLVDAKCFQTRCFRLADATHTTVDLIAFFQKEFGQISAVLACDAGDKCFFH